MVNEMFPNMPSSENLTGGQVLTVVSLERTGGCISLVAVMLIFIAYWLFPEVRNVQNTFIVFASVSNVGASIASVIAMDGLVRGHSSGLCQAQSFMFEMCVGGTMVNCDGSLLIIGQVHAVGSMVVPGHGY